MSNTVTITLQARDEASAVISRLTRQLDTGLNRSLGRTVLGANLMTSAVTTGLQGLSSLVGGIGTKLNQAMGIQQQNISTAGTLMKLIGLDFDEATNFIDSFSVSMSKVAASLPGATSDYVNLGKGIMDNLVPAFKALDGSFDRGGYTEALNSISKDAGFLAATSGVNTSLAGLGISKFLGGASTSALQQLKFFEANPAILSFIEKEAQNLGKEIKDLTANERVKVLQAALKVPDEVIKASTTSISGLIEGFKSTLFDPQSGVFGLMKDLTDQKGSSVFNSLNNTFRGLFGENGLFKQLGDILTRFGLVSGSPLIPLKKIIDSFTGSVEYLTSIFKLFNDNVWTFNLEAQTKNLKRNLKFFFEEFFDMSGLGKALADAVNWLFRALSLSLQSGGLEAMLGGVFKGIGSFFANLDGGVYGAIGAAIIFKVGLPIAFKAIALKLAGALIATSVGPIIAQMLPALIAGFAQLTALIAGPAGWIILAVGLIATALLKSPDLRNAIWNGVRGLSTAVGSFFRNMVSGLRSSLEDIPVVGSILTGGSKFSRDMEARAEARYGDGSSIPNRAGGQNFSGLLNAANRELKQTPPGSGLVVANSSETILNRAQQSRVMAAINSKPGLTIGNINIYSQATNAQEIAKDVVGYITQEYQRYAQNHIAAPVG